MTIWANQQQDRVGDTGNSMIRTPLKVDKVDRISDWQLPCDIASSPGCARDRVVDWPATECVDDHQAGHCHHTNPARSNAVNTKKSHSNTKLNAKPKTDTIKSRGGNILQFSWWWFVHPQRMEIDGYWLETSLFGVGLLSLDQVIGGLTDKPQSWETPPREEIWWSACCPTVAGQPLKGKSYTWIF